MFAKAVRTVFTIIGSVVIIGAIIIGIMMAMGKKPLSRFTNQQVEQITEVKMMMDENGLPVVDTNSLRSNVVNENNGEVTNSAQYVDTIQKYRYEELNKAAPEAINHTSIQDPEERKKFDAEVMKGTAPSMTNVVYDTSLSSETILIDQGDYANVINQSPRTIIIKGVTVPSEFTIEAGQALSTEFDYLGEFKYEVDGKTFTVVVKTRS